LAAPHDSRIQDADLITRTCCPTCQVTPGTPCRTDYGQHYPGLHPARRRASNTPPAN
jgi:hypothetical protein